MLKYPEIEINVSAHDPFTEVSLINGKLQLVKKSVSFLQEVVAPGIFKLRYSSGGNISEQIIQITGDKPKEFFEQEGTVLVSAAPLTNTLEGGLASVRYADDIVNLSRKEIPEDQSSLFLLWREPMRKKEKKPASLFLSVEIQTADGEKILPDASKKLEVVDKTAELEIIAWNVTVKPGFYCLRIRGESYEYFQGIYAVAGWQTQIFVHKPNDVPYSESISVNMAKPEIGFDADSEVFHWAEQARQGLASRYSSNRANSLSSGLQSLPADNLDKLREMLGHKAENPMLGIFAAQLMLQSDTYDRDFLKLVASNLRRLVGDIPDVVSIYARLHQDGVVNEPLESCEFPPMLAHSWSALVKASSKNLSIVESDSFASSVAIASMSKDGWLCWRDLKIPSMINVDSDFETIVKRVYKWTNLLGKSTLTIKEILNNTIVDDETADLVISYLSPVLPHLEQVIDQIQGGWSEKVLVISDELEKVIRGEGDIALKLDPKSLVEITGLPWAAISDLLRQAHLLLTNFVAWYKQQ